MAQALRSGQNALARAGQSGASEPPGQAPGSPGGPFDPSEGDQRRVLGGRSGGTGPESFRDDRRQGQRTGGGPRGGAATGGTGGPSGPERPGQGPGFDTLAPGREDNRGGYGVTGTFRDQPDAAPSRSRYVDASPDLRRSAEAVLNREHVPAPYAARVRKYFESISPK
ncbi:MAG: hypothetical protein HY320_15770 [Armatimonadetes bacterium]|nr:hypothetical protein [Armatimonadota bacterium]